MIVALLVQKTLTYYAKSKEWNYKKNYVKKTQCYYYSSNKYLFKIYLSKKNDCVKEAFIYPHCIVYNNSRNSTYEKCLLRPRYFKE